MSLLLDVAASFAGLQHAMQGLLGRSRHRAAGQSTDLLGCCVINSQVLSLESLGAKCASTWQPHEELLFCLGM